MIYLDQDYIHCQQLKFRFYPKNLNFWLLLKVVRYSDLFSVESISIYLYINEARAETLEEAVTGEEKMPRDSGSH